jgi:hypothetical protein
MSFEEKFKLFVGYVELLVGQETRRTETFSSCIAVALCFVRIGYLAVENL